MTASSLPKRVVFCRKFNILSDDFARSGLRWTDLVSIHRDYCSWWRDQLPVAECLAAKLGMAEQVHASRARVKAPDHLIEKIIRASAEVGSPYATPGNYRDVVTDLIGARALHLFKEDWLTVHKYICATWTLRGTPVANVMGDPSYMISEYQRNGCEIRQRASGYRSVHYLADVPYGKKTYVAEIQVRTLFEEAWGEVNHSVVYPYFQKHPLLKKFASIMSLLGGKADTGGSLMRVTKSLTVKRRPRGKKSRKEFQRLVTQYGERLKVFLDEPNSISRLLLDPSQLSPEQLKRAIDATLRRSRRK